MEFGLLGLAPEINAVAQESRRKAIESHCRVVTERTIVASSGEFILEVTNTPLIGPDGTCTHLLTSIWDVTSRRLAARRERELRDATLRTCKRWNALGCLAGGVAHDFNNLLARIIGYSELAASNPRCRRSPRGGDSGRSSSRCRSGAANPGVQSPAAHRPSPRSRWRAWSVRSVICCGRDCRPV